MKNRKSIKGFIVCILLVFALLYSVQLMAEEKTGTIVGKVKIDEKGNVTILPSTSDETAKVKVKTNNDPIQPSGDNGKDLNILQSQEPIKASNSDANKAIMEYQALLSRQESPLKTADEELYNIDGTIWQRKYGEYEFFLAPSVENIGEYKARISKYDNKEKGINKSISQFIKSKS